MNHRQAKKILRRGWAYSRRDLHQRAVRIVVRKRRRYITETRPTLAYSFLKHQVDAIRPTLAYSFLKHQVDAIRRSMDLEVLRLLEARTSQQLQSEIRIRYVPDHKPTFFPKINPV